MRKDEGKNVSTIGKKCSQVLTTETRAFLSGYEKEKERERDDWV